MINRQKERCGQKIQRVTYTFIQYVVILPLIAERVTRTLLDVTYCTKFALFLIFYILLLVRSGAVV